MPTLTFILIHTLLALLSARLVPRRHYSQLYSQDRTDYGIINALRILIPLYFFLCFTTGEAQLTIVSLSATTLGYLLLTLSFILTTIAQLHNINATPQFQLPMNICRTGPYAYIRHPIYLSALLYYISINYIFQSPYAIPIAITICTLYIIRAHNEDQLLKLASITYVGYRLLVPGMFIPRKSTLA